MDETKKNSTLPFVLSLLSVIFVFVPGLGAIVGLILGIIGLVLTINARKTNSDSLLTAAFVLSIIGIAVAGIQIVFLLVAVGLFSAMATSGVEHVFDTIFY